MAFAFNGIIVSIIIILIMVAIEEIDKEEIDKQNNETIFSKTVDLTNGLENITIPSFEEWCDQNSESIPVANPIVNPSINTKEAPDETISNTETTDVKATVETELINAGIAKNRIKILLEAFGDDIFNVAKEGGIKALTSLKGIGDATAAKVVALANQIRKE